MCKKDAFGVIIWIECSHGITNLELSVKINGDMEL